MELSVRKANKNDANDIATIGLNLNHRSEAGNVRKYLENLGEENEGCVYIACMDDKVIGYIHAAMRNMLVSGSTAEILEIAVDKDFRMKGVGKMLFEKVKEWSAIKGSVILVRTNVNNKVANKFYKSLGMNKVSEQCVFTMEISI